jgi:hypothetical protein
MKSIPVFLISAFLVFASLTAPGRTFAQDDFPPPGIFIPCCSTGGTGGSTGAVYGENGQSAWRQVWGAAPGDIVTFRFVLRSRSAGALHAWPQTTGGTDMQYVGDPNNIYEKWYWDTGQRSSGGTFCLDCPWQFVANSFNPWIYIDYWDSGDGWDVDLNVTNIQSPPRTLFSVLSDPDKDTANGISVGLAAFGGVMVSFQNVFGADPPLNIIFGTLGYGAGLIAYHFGVIAHDPWDGDYCSTPGFSLNPQTQADLDWAYSYDPTGYLITSIEYIEGYAIFAETAANRALSAASDGNMDCAWARRSEAVWGMNSMGVWLSYFNWNIQVIADENAGVADMSELYSELYSLDAAGTWLRGLQ